MTISQNKMPKVSLLYAQRKIIFHDEVDDDSCYEFMNCINRLLYFDSKLDTHDAIEIMINSPGGSVYHCFTIMSKIEQLIDMGYHIITTNIGMCFSAAFIIFLCGQERRMYRYSRCMYHDISTIAYGKSQEIKEDLKECQELLHMLDRKIIEETSITQNQLDEWKERKTDKYFSAVESLEYNIATVIE